MTRSRDRRRERAAGRSCCWIWPLAAALAIHGAAWAAEDAQEPARAATSTAADAA